MVEEVQFLSEGSAVVTSSRIVLDGKTFATRNVGSVMVVTVPPSRTLAIIFVLIGLAMTVGGSDETRVMGALLALGGLIWAITVKPVSQLKLMAGGGEVVALTSHNTAYMKRVHDAIADAISVR